jgi:hypothetical protein
MEQDLNEVKTCFIAKDFAIGDLHSPAWEDAERVLIHHYWSGEEAPATRHSTAQILWSRDALYARFINAQFEPLIGNISPKVETKTLGLWDRDVSELFIGPDPNDPDLYFEFEGAPTGEWVDLKVRLTKVGRQTDYDFSSGMECAAEIGSQKTTIAIKIPWTAFGFVPERNQRLRGNLFRCVGEDPTRGYLAWRPTLTVEPNFHVPSAFGWFRF